MTLAILIIVSLMLLAEALSVVRDHRLHEATRAWVVLAAKNPEKARLILRKMLADDEQKDGE